MLVNLINNILKVAVNNKDIPGVHFGLLYQDRIYTGFVGYKSIYKKPQYLTGDEIYDIASLSKVVATTTIIMKLAEENMLSLQDKVSKYLPKFKHHNVTIENLMVHNSGLRADVFKSKDMKSKNDVLSAVYNVELINETGQKCVYSDVGFILLGEIIESVCGKSLDKVAQALIFEPLRMNNTRYCPDKKRVAPTEYRNDSVYQGLLVGRVHDEKSFAMQGISGHAGVFSTVYDLCLFMKSIINEQSVIKKETINQLFGVNNITKEPSTRALGWDKPQIGGQCGDTFDFTNTICHTGFTGCNMLINKLEKFGFVMLSNAVHPNRNNNKIFKYRYTIGKVIHNYIKSQT